MSEIRLITEDGDSLEGMVFDPQNYKHRLIEIRSRQYRFQKMMGINMIPSTVGEVYHLAESYLMKTFEEVAELRKTFPSGFNRWEKNPPRTDSEEMHRRILEELSDVHLFLVNFMLVWSISFDELLDVMEEVQKNNFRVLSEKLARQEENDSKAPKA